VCDVSVVQSLAVQDDFEPPHGHRPVAPDDVKVEQHQQSSKLVSNFCQPSSFHYSFSEMDILSEFTRHFSVMFCPQKNMTA